MIDRRVHLLVSTIVRVVVQEALPLALLSDAQSDPNLSQSSETTKQGVSSIGPRRVLVVDDEKVIADSVAMILNRNGFTAEARYSGTAALESIQGQCPDIIVCDVVMPDFNGIQVARAVRSLCPGVRIVLFSGNVDASTLLDDASIEGYFFEILAKPVHPLTLLKALGNDPSA